MRFLSRKNLDKQSSNGRICANRFERLEDRRMLAFSAPDVLVADDAGHLVTAGEWPGGPTTGYRNIMTQSDGKIVVAGTAVGPNGSEDFYLARYLADGVNGFVLDTSYGTNGVAFASFKTGGKPSSRHDLLRGAEMDSQDRVVAVGQAYLDTTVVARFTPDGHLDSTFSEDGYDTQESLAIWNTDSDWQVAFNSDDEPLIAAIVYDNRDAIGTFRYDASGVFDTASGVQLTSVPDRTLYRSRDHNFDVAIYPDSDATNAGKIVLTGSMIGEMFEPEVGGNVVRRDWTVWRLNPDGSPDTSFDGDGYSFQRVFDPSPTPYVDPNGSISDNSYALGVVIEPDGRITAAGYTAEGLTLTRYNADGSYDETFNPGGIQPGRAGLWIEALGHVNHGDLLAGEFGTHLTRDTDGNYVVGGHWKYLGGDNDGDGYVDDTSGVLDRFAFARFLSDGTVDTTFGDGEDGSYLEYVGAGRNRLSGLTLTGSGEIWASGYDADRKSILLRFAEQADNSPPVALDDALATDEDSLLAISAPGVLANDSDPDGDALVVVAFDAVSTQGAVVSVNGDGGISYDPRSATALQNLSIGETLQDTFTYTISDGHGGSATATVQVTVQGLEEPPTSDTPLLINDIRFDSKRGGKDWRAVVEIHDVNGNAVAGVSLKVDFAGTTYTLTTDSTGIARTSWKRNLSQGDYLADAYDLALTGYVWYPFAFDLEDDSDGDGKPDDVLVV